MRAPGERSNDHQNEKNPITTDGADLRSSGLAASPRCETCLGKALRRSRERDRGNRPVRLSSIRSAANDMSIYATLWKLKFPKEGDDYAGCDWIAITAQGVPPHIGSPTPGMGYESGDPYADFLPPPVKTDVNGDAPFMRAVVFVTEFSIKGTERNGQEYVSPLLVLSGEEYARITFQDLYARLCDALRGNRAPVVMEILNPDGTHKIVRNKRKGKKEPSQNTEGPK